MLDAEDVRNGRDYVYGRVVVGDDDALLDVRAGKERNAAMCIDMVRAILSIVFQNNDQRIVVVALALGHFLHNQSNGVVIVCGLDFGRVYAVNSRAEVAGVVVHHADEF